MRFRTKCVNKCLHENESSPRPRTCISFLADVGICVGAYVGIYVGICVGICGGADVGADVLMSICR